MRSPALLWILLASAGCRISDAEEAVVLRSWTCTRQVRAVCTWRGRVLAATSGGVLELAGPGRVRKWTTAAGLPENDALALLPTPDGVVVAFRRSLGRYDGRAWNSLPPLPGANAASAPSLAWWGGRLTALAGGRLLTLTGTAGAWIEVPSPAAATSAGVVRDRLYLLAGRRIHRRTGTDDWTLVGELNHAPEPREVVGWFESGSGGVLALRDALYRLDGTGVRRLPLTGPDAPAAGVTHLGGAVSLPGRLLLALPGSGLHEVGAGLSTDGFRRLATPAPVDARCVASAPWGLVAGTSRGLFVRDGRGWTAVEAPDELPAPACTALAWHQGGPWLALQDGSLARLDGSRWRAVPGPERSHVLQLAASDALWARHPDGSLSRRDGETWQAVAPAGRDRLTWTSSLAGDGDGVNIGTWGGVVRFPARSTGAAREEYLRGFPFPTEAATATVTHRGRLWVGTQRRGLAVWTGDGWRVHDEGSGLPECWITALASDGERLWAGTFNGGLACWDGVRWRREDPLPSREGRKITCLAVDGSGGAWVGTRGGLALRGRGEWRTWTQVQGLAGDEVQALLAHGDEVWVGTRSGVTRISRSGTGGGE